MHGHKDGPKWCAVNLKLANNHSGEAAARSEFEEKGRPESVLRHRRRQIRVQGWTGGRRRLPPLCFGENHLFREFHPSSPFDQDTDAPRGTWREHQT